WGGSPWGTCPPPWGTCPPWNWGPSMDPRWMMWEQFSMIREMYSLVQDMHEMMTERHRQPCPRSE
ncbi:MAG: hypothetical protein WAP33_09605, partial [bacterium]